MREERPGATPVSQSFLLKLIDDLHAALKLWHKPGPYASPLSHLYLFQQAQRATGNPRAATNQVILDTLQALEAEQGQYARLLRLRFLDQSKVFNIARQLDIAEVTVYRQQREAIQHLATLLAVREHQARAECQTGLERRLNLPPQVELVGVEPDLTKLLELLAQPGPPWLVSLEGIGGIGKTTLANALVRELILTDRFQAIAWVSAKQQDFLPGAGLQPTHLPALDEDTLVNSLLAQLQPATAEVGPSPQAKLAALQTLLQAAPCLVIVDNLETVADYQTLLPTLRQLAKPSRFLLTSRHSLQAYAEVYCHSLQELSRADTLTFLQYEAQLRGLPTLATASEAELASIYDVAGGNPLALKLIVGQIGFLSLAQVLDNLKQARGRKIDELYSHIYWQAWHSLDGVAQTVLLAMPLAQDGDFAQLAAVNRLEADELNDALDQLVTLSLVEGRGDLTARHYRIHRLTETFLLTEVAKWQVAL